MSERVDAGRALPDECEWRSRSERGEVGVGGSVRAPVMRGTAASGVRGGDDDVGDCDCGWSRICADGRRGWDDWVTRCSASVGCEDGSFGLRRAVGLLLLLLLLCGFGGEGIRAAGAATGGG
jgi:hypothetical protein